LLHGLAIAEIGCLLVILRGHMVIARDAGTVEVMVGDDLETKGIAGGD
jgi:hypothetical protein